MPSRWRPALDFKRQIGTVGGEDVDAEIEHLGDRRCIVASPAADAEAGLADFGDRRRIEHVAAQAEHGHAVAAGEVDHRRKADIGLGLGRHQPDMAHRRAVAGHLGHGAELEAGHHRAIEDAARLERGHDPGGMVGIGHAARAGLHLQAQDDLGRPEDLDNLVEQQHALAAAALEDELRQIRPIMLADGAGAVGGPLQRGVMDHHQPAVARGMDVEFDLLDRQLGGLFEGEAAVLRPQQGAATVRGDFGHRRKTPRRDHRRVGSRRSRSQSPMMLIDSVVRMMTALGNSRIHEARVRYSRP